MRGQRVFVELDGQPPVALAALYGDLVAQSHCSVSYQIVCRRIAKGWSALDALIIPPTTRGRKKGALQ